MTSRDNYFTSQLSDHLLRNEMEPQKKDDVMEKIITWKSRPLAARYPLIFFDYLDYHLADQTSIEAKKLYFAVAITKEGYRDMVGCWVDNPQDNTFWLTIMMELKIRGLEEVSVIGFDNMHGLTDAIKSIFPETRVQLCLAAMIRESKERIVNQQSQEFNNDLESVFNVGTEKEAQNGLECLIEKWNEDYPLAVKPWVFKWEQFIPIIKRTPSYYKRTCITNYSEDFVTQFYKATNHCVAFSSNESVLKMGFSKMTELSKKWDSPIPNWDALSLQIQNIEKHYKKESNDHE